MSGSRDGVVWAKVAADLAVSRETSLCLERFVALLTKWQASINLIGPRTLSQVWDRHIADSAQLLFHAPSRGRWVDLGTGGGFPGIVLAILCRGLPAFSIDLVESNSKKCSFLRSVIGDLDLPARVVDRRIEEAVSCGARAYDIVTARALAPLERLVVWSEELLDNGGLALFPKGREVEAELTAIPESVRRRTALLPSVSDDGGRIVRIERGAVPPATE